MRRSLLAALLLLLLVAAALAASPAPRPRLAVATPDPSRSKPQPRWPNEADLARLASVEGQDREHVLAQLGHPRKVRKLKGGEEVWEYDWRAACEVRLRHGVCTSTFYTGGY